MISPPVVFGLVVSRARHLRYVRCHKGCVVAPDTFATSMDWLLERSVGIGTDGVMFGQSSFTDLDFAESVP